MPGMRLCGLRKRDINPSDCFSLVFFIFIFIGQGFV